MGTLITGGAGYIGSHMALALIDAGEVVVVVDNLSTGLRWAVPADAKFVEGDVGDSGLIKRLVERMPEASAEHGMVRSYLDWLTELPWSKLSEERIDIAEARRILDEDHYGLPKIKQRILKFLAVRKLKPDGKSPILCFVGPPGVGKTSLGQSIARATSRKFQRISLGGVHDEAGTIAIFSF